MTSGFAEMSSGVPSAMTAPATSTVMRVAKTENQMHVVFDEKQRHVGGQVADDFEQFGAFG